MSQTLFPLRVLPRKLSWRLQPHGSLSGGVGFALESSDFEPGFSPSGCSTLGLCVGELLFQPERITDKKEFCKLLPVFFIPRTFVEPQLYLPLQLMVPEGLVHHFTRVLTHVLGLSSRLALHCCNFLFLSLRWESNPGKVLYHWAICGPVSLWRKLDGLGVLSEVEPFILIYSAIYSYLLDTFIYWHSMSQGCQGEPDRQGLCPDSYFSFEGFIICGLIQRLERQ
jgi:hypothetical protein